jgi:ankyrin repeat protein
MKILKGPSDEDIHNILINLPIDQIIVKTIKHNIGEMGYQIAIDKGLFDKVSSKEALYSAIYCNTIKYVKHFIESDISLLNCKFYNESTPILTASYVGHIEIIEYLIEKGADINSIGDHGLTPLLMAVYNGKFNAVKYLVEHGANINHRNIEKYNAVDIAIRWEYTEIVHYLKKIRLLKYLNN